MSLEATDYPAKWSVLMQTTTDLLGLNDKAVDALWESAGERCVSEVLDLTEADWDKLAAVAIYRDDSFDMLLSLTLGYFVELEIGIQLLDAMVRAAATMVGVSGDATFVRVVNEASDQPIIADFEVASIRNFRVDSFDVPQELSSKLRERGLTKWKDLTFPTEKNILESSSLCLETLRQIKELWLMKTYSYKASLRLAGLPIESFASFESMVRAFVGLVTKTARDRSILLGRIGILENRKWSLDDLGNLLGLTRERVRQVEQKKMDILASAGMVAKLARFWFAIEETLGVSGGACLIGELGNQVAVKLDWEREPSEDALLSMLQLPELFRIDKDNGLVCDPSHRCLSCEAVVNDLEGLFGSDRYERPRMEVIKCLLSGCAQVDRCREYSASLSFSEGFLLYVARKTQGVSVVDGEVFCRDIRGSRVQLVERILKDAGRPMHFSEVYEHASKLFPNDTYVTERNVYGWISNSANLLLWDRGTYIHRELAKIPKELIVKVEGWLGHKLENGVPFVSVFGARLAFEKELIEAGISSESALYSCLRESGNDALLYPHYPYIIPNRPGCEMLPITIALEQYILDAGGLVTIREMKAYAVGKLCISEQMFPIHWANVPNIVRAGRGLYIHVENLKLDDSKLAAVTTYAATLACVDGHVSVKKVYTDKQISCFSMGIESPEMLYAVLQRHANEAIKTPKYPKILASKSQQDDADSRGVINEVVDYIARNQRPCSYDELDQHFVAKLGYNTNTVYSVRLHDNVVPYSRGSVVHLDTIEWSNKKYRKLEYQAYNALGKARNAGRFYAQIGYLLEFHKLPELANGIVWTQKLLSEIIARFRRFKVLGQARNAYIAIPNDEGIATFEDFIYELLKKDYEGACELKKFEHYLLDAGIVHKRLTPRMLGDQKKVCISGHIIMLRELCRGT